MNIYNRPHIVIFIPNASVGEISFFIVMIRMLQEKYKDASLAIVIPDLPAYIKDILSQMTQQVTIHTFYAGFLIFKHFSLFINFINLLLTFKPDIAIDAGTSRNFLSKLIRIMAYLGGVPQRLGWSLGGIWNKLLTSKVRRRQDYAQLHYLEQLMSLVAPLGLTDISIDKLERPYIFLAHQEESVDKAAALVVLHVGSRNPLKVWEPSNFVSLIRQFKKDYSTRIVLVGSKQDMLYASSIAASIPDLVDNQCCKLSLSQTCRLLKKADLVIGNDSGVVHLAVALGVPTICIFACGAYFNLVEWGYPFNDYFPLYSRKSNCGWCTGLVWEKCPFFKRKTCLNAINSEAVFLTGKKILSKVAPSV